MRILDTLMINITANDSLLTIEKVCHPDPASHKEASQDKGVRRVPDVALA